jgi:hypothetical protein
VAFRPLAQILVNHDAMALLWAAAGPNRAPIIYWKPRG